MASQEATKPVFSGRSDAESPAWLQYLPPYSRSLLKIKVPVTVTLATSKQSVRSILELVPGSIIQFEKLCDEMLSLEVGNHPVAEGETVKVGDKFGLRLTSMVLPERAVPHRHGPGHSRLAAGIAGRQDVTTLSTASVPCRFEGLCPLRPRRHFRRPGKQLRWTHVHGLASPGVCTAPGDRIQMILIIDNYDSFTYNLVQRLGEIDSSLDIQVYRNNCITLDEIESRQPSHLIISPGPCTPKEAGISVDCVQRFMGKLPILGVCLGHQSIGQATGGEIVRARELMHGKTDAIHHDNQGLFDGSAQSVHRHEIPQPCHPAGHCA